MDESRVEVDIEISRAMQLIDSTAEWELRELQTFTSTLVGQHHVSAESNPFRPLVYATALWDAACAIVAVADPARDRPAHVRRRCRRPAEERLPRRRRRGSKRRACEPGVYRTVVLPSASASAVRSPSRRARAPLSGAAGAACRSRIGRRAQRRRARALERRRRPAAGAQRRRDRGAAAELEQALLRLDELLRHPPLETLAPGRGDAGQRVEQHRSALLASASEPVDRQVIELVTRLFESLLPIRCCRAPFARSISRMQVAALRVCLADHAALDSYDHPVWRLLDRIGETSQGYSRVEDPRLSGFLAFAGAVAEEMAGARGARHARCSGAA